MPVPQSVCNFGWKAIDFKLPGTDGNIHSLADLVGRRGTLIVFICNHCPYVKAIIEPLVRDVAELAKQGINTAAICSNDSTGYPEDSFEKMAKFASDYGFCFPYLHDESQGVAVAYGAVCTPDFFGFNKDLELQYRGRYDEGRLQRHPSRSSSELYEAMTQIAQTGSGPQQQVASMGCSIKWK